MKERRDIQTYGERGRSARVFVERGGKMIRVQWRIHGALKTQSFPSTAIGKANARQYAQGVVESLEARKLPARVTVAELWGRYAESELTNLRPRTFALNADAWRKWELFVGRETVAEDLGVDSMAGLRAELERKYKLGVNTIARIVRGVKVVYNWGEAHELLARNKLHRYRYKVGKDKRPPKVAEYRREDFDALCAALPLEGRNWRAGGIVRLCGYQGIRQGAVRHLRWEDVDFAAGTIRWRPEWDKLGRDWSQPLRTSTAQTLERLALRASGEPWVFPAPRTRKSGDAVYSAQALWWALTEAEKRAGIEHKANRGAHGLRRMLAGDVLAVTGNLKTAGDAIGDKDLRILQEHYLSDRPEEVRAAFDALDRKSNGNRNGEDTLTTQVVAVSDEGGGTRTHDLAYKGKAQLSDVPGKPSLASAADTPLVSPKPGRNRNRNRNGTATGGRP